MIIPKKVGNARGSRGGAGHNMEERPGDGDKTPLGRAKFPRGGEETKGGKQF